MPDLLQLVRFLHRQPFRQTLALDMAPIWHQRRRALQSPRHLQHLLLQLQTQDPRPWRIFMPDSLLLAK